MLKKHIIYLLLLLALSFSSYSQTDCSIISPITVGQEIIVPSVLNYTVRDLLDFNKITSMVWEITQGGSTEEYVWSSGSKSRFLSKDFNITENAFTITFKYVSSGTEYYCSKTETIVEQQSDLQADFSSDYSFERSLVPCTIKFSDKSKSSVYNIVKWEWDFGDGSKGNDQNPTHSYSKEGSYSVVLKVTDSSGGFSEERKKNYVTVFSGVEADFRIEEQAGIFVGDPFVFLVDNKNDWTDTPLDGKSWRTAYTSIEDAILASMSAIGEYGEIEIWVTGGYYSYSYGFDTTIVENCGKVSILGGYTTQSYKKSDRDVENNATVISLLDGSDSIDTAFIINSCTSLEGEGEDFSFNGVTIDGFVFVGGKDGAIQSNTGKLNVSNCNFLFNYSTQLDYGGGIYSICDFNVDNSVFKYNIGGAGSSLYGYNFIGFDADRDIISNCIFSDNKTFSDTTLMVSSTQTENGVMSLFFSGSGVEQEGEGEGEYAFEGGYIIVNNYHGNPEEYIEISSITELQKIGNDDAYPLDGKYYLKSDIDASVTTSWNDGKGFSPIGSSLSPFTGIFDGNGHKISNLYINRTALDFVGVFGYADGTFSGKIENLIVDSVDITGKTYVGGVVGVLYEGFDLLNSDVSGKVVGNEYVGGLVGSSFSFCNINSSSSNVNVEGKNYAGGIAGSNAGAVLNVNSSGNVVGSRWVGGLVGFDTGQIRYSYSSSNVDGKRDVGGLIGYKSGYLLHLYSYGRVSGEVNLGGLIGSVDVLSPPTAINSCFYNITTSGQTDTGKGVGKPDSEMKLQKTYDGWDFYNVWKIEEGIGYPEFLERNNYISNSYGYDNLDILYDLGGVKIYNITEFIYDLILKDGEFNVFSDNMEYSFDMGDTVENEYPLSNTTYCGTVNLYGDSELRLFGNTFSYNESSLDGSCFVGSGNFVFEENKFIYNTSGDFPVAIKGNLSEQKTTFDRCLFFGNNGAVKSVDSDFDFSYSLLSENVVPVLEITEEGDSQFINCSIIDNYYFIENSNNRSPNNLFSLVDGSTVNLKNSIIYWGEWEDGVEYVLNSGTGGEITEEDSSVFENPEDVLFEDGYTEYTFKLKDGNDYVDIENRGYAVSEDVYAETAYIPESNIVSLRSPEWGDKNLLEVFRRDYYGEDIYNYYGSGVQNMVISDNMNYGVYASIDPVALLPSPLQANTEYKLNLVSWEAYSFLKDGIIVPLDTTGNLDGEGEYYENRGLIFSPVVRIEPEYIENSSSLVTGDFCDLGMGSAECFDSFLRCGTLSLMNENDVNTYFVYIEIFSHIPINNFTVNIDGKEEYSGDLEENNSLSLYSFLSDVSNEVKVEFTSDICSYDIVEINSETEFKNIVSFDRNKIYSLNKSLVFDREDIGSRIIPREMNGLFLGNGFKISNFSTNVSGLTNKKDIGLFSRISNTGCVVGLRLENADTIIDKTTENVGILCGVLEGTVSNCSIVGDNSSIRRDKNDFTSDSIKMGGLVGRLDGGGIYDSYVDLDVPIDFYTSSYTSPNCTYVDEEKSLFRFMDVDGVSDGKIFCGGLVGEVVSGTIEKCWVEDVYVGYNTFVYNAIGGLVGRLISGSIKKSYTRSEISIQYGIESESFFPLNNFYLEEEINNSPFGSFVGTSSGGSVEECFSSSKLNVSVYDTENTVEGEEEYFCLFGEFLGEGSFDTVSSCFYNATLVSKNKGEDSDGIDGIVSIDFGKEDSFYGWDFSDCWGIGSGKIYIKRTEGYHGILDFNAFDILSKKKEFFDYNRNVLSLDYSSSIMSVADVFSFDFSQSPENLDFVVLRSLFGNDFNGYADAPVKVLSPYEVSVFGLEVVGGYTLLDVGYGNGDFLVGSEAIIGDNEYTIVQSISDRWVRINSSLLGLFDSFVVKNRYVLDEIN